MELTHEHSLLDELITAPKIDTSFCNEFNFPNSWNFMAPLDQIQTTPDLHFPSATANPPFLELISPTDHQLNYPCPFGEFQPFLDVLTSPEYSAAAAFQETDHDLPPMATHEDYYGFTNAEASQLGSFLDHSNGMSCFESAAQNDRISNMENSINVEGLYGEIKKSKTKKADGQPSKNLMAERRRRKRLNDRLSMLRSIVPKISKMDRTSILGDTIDYMRELLEKIAKLREQGLVDENADKISLVKHNMKELKPNDMLVRNPPKFGVERRDEDTRVEVCCSAKPGLLLSTLSTLDSLGLDIQQCVISCFSDFTVQASCQEVAEHRSIISCEDVKQALFRNAGYGGRCL